MSAKTAIGWLNNINTSPFFRMSTQFLSWLIIGAILTLPVFTLLVAIYNLYFHPLRNFPGPKLAAATPFPFVWRVINGRMVHWLNGLHAKYGSVVRIHPDELTFVESSAWSDIYIARPSLPKPTFGVLETPNGVPSIGTIPDAETHARHRKILNYGFSDRVLREQEYILQTYTDLLISRLREDKKLGTSSHEVDICEWYNFTTFDVLGDLAFGESFHCLENGNNHPWVVATFKGVKFAQLLTVFHHFPPMATIVKWCIPASIKEIAQRTFTWTRERVTRRIESKTDRPDFIKFILENNYPGGMTREDIDATATLLVLAGSETSATTLAAATFFALSNPSVMQKLQHEVRGALEKSPNNIGIGEVSELPYMHAVFQETLRMHPTGPVSVPREVDRPGVEVCGRLIPVGARVGIPQKTANRLPCNFVDPDSYIPERWLDGADPKFAQDKKDVCEPFMVGPRNCIGKSFAWAEMKLVLAKMIVNFDIELTNRNVGDWSDQKVYLINEKTPLYVRLRPRM